jgi:hypothetical protein
LTRITHALARSGGGALPTGGPTNYRRYSPSGTRPQIVILTALAFGGAIVATQAPTAGRALIGILGFVAFLLVAMADRRLAVSLVLIFLVLLGFVRRALIPFTGWADNDPLLLVSPAAATALWYLGRAHRARRGFLSSAAAFLLLWCLAQVFNPNAADLLTSAQSLLFYVTPIVWFFVGRSFDGDTHDRILRIILWMGVPVVALGMYHSFGHFFPFELTWVGVSNQSDAIFLPGFQIRPFSTMTSPQEYGFFLGFVLMIIWARLLHHPTRPVVLAGAFAITTAALFLQASRSIFLLFLVALAVTSLVRYRSPVTVLCLLLVMAALLAYANGVKGTVTEEEGVAAPTKHPIRALVDHELVGLSDPGSGTGPVHVDLVTKGLTAGIKHPLGVGVSYGQIAEQKNAPGRSISSESDIGNVAAGLGIFAGLTLIAFIGIALVTATRIQIGAPSVRHLAIVGIGVVAMGQWLSGSLYSTSAILWFLLGGLARETAGSESTPGFPLRARSSAAERPATVA